MSVESEKSKKSCWFLAVTGWITLLLLYWLQVGLLVSFLVLHLDDCDYVAWFLWFTPAFILTLFFFYQNKGYYVKEDEAIWGVWIIWNTYIVPYTLTVAMIFCRFADKLTKQDTLGVNALKSTLCITPAMLILFLQLAIDSKYRKDILYISIFAALDIFDGIEMLETFLMQNEGYFDLNGHTERSIIAFACICFLLTSLGLARHKFKNGNGEVEKTREDIVFVFLEVCCTNLSFLVIRAVIWGVHGHESAVFIAKNAVGLVMGALEFGKLIKTQAAK